MVNLNVFLSRLIPQAPACSEPFALQCLRDAAIDFCEKSLVMRQKLDTFYCYNGRAQYDLDVPSCDYQIARVLSVKVNGRLLNGVLQEDKDDLPADQAGTPLRFYTTRVDNALVLNLHPAPTERFPVVVEVALKPTRDTDRVDDELYNVWADAIIDGALSRICRVPNQPFSDVSFAAAMQASFADKTARAKIEGYHGRMRGNSTVKTRPFA